MKTKVYLAGGFGGDWQNSVMQELGENFVFFNPKEHRLTIEKQYTVWDLHYIRQCDILFGYLSSENPSGYGLCLEVGYARGINKTIILVDENSGGDEEFARYYRIVHATSSIQFSTLQDGIDYLKTFSASSTN